MLLAVVVPLQSFGQNPVTASTSSSPPSSSSGTGSGGSLNIESQQMAYEAINDLADEIAYRIDKSNQCTGCTILLGTPANTAAIAAFTAFRVATTQLSQAYKHSKEGKPDNLLGRDHIFFGQPLTLGGLAADQALGPIMSGLSSLLTSMKAGTTMSGGTFAPVDQALYSDLERAICTGTISTNHPADGPDPTTKRQLIVTAFPDDLASAAVIVAGMMQQVYADRTDALNGKAPADLKDIESQLTALQASLTNPTGGAGAIILGAALLRKVDVIDNAGNAVQVDTGKANEQHPKDNGSATAHASSTAEAQNTTAEKKAEAQIPQAVQKTYLVLTVTNDVAGGGSRTNQYFFISLFAPSFHPSYNGGAVVSFSLRDNAGKYICADTIRLMLGYSKWHQPTRKNENGESAFASFHWRKHRTE